MSDRFGRGIKRRQAVDFGCVDMGIAMSEQAAPIPDEEQLPTLARYADRLHRLHEGKSEAFIFDCADLNAPMLAMMYEGRRAGYGDIGYELVE